MFNKSTSFIDGDFVYGDYKQLLRVLECFHELNPTYLEILHYRQSIWIPIYEEEQENNIIEHVENNNTALHVAVRQGNTKSADIILEYMAKIKYDSSRNFKDIFSKLVEYKSFHIYLAALPQQTR